MQLTVRYQKIFQSILTILSLVSSGLLFAILRQEIIMNRSDPNENYPYSPLIAFACVFIINAINYWLLDRKYIKQIQNGLLVVQLGFLLSSAFSGYPAEIDFVPSWLGSLSIICLAITIVLGFIYVNLPALTNWQRVFLFSLKFLSSLVALGVAFFLFLNVTIGGDTFLMMPQTEQNWALAGMFLWMGLNVAEGIFIWFKAFRSWWAWLLSILVLLEVIVPVAFDFFLEKSWSTILLAIAAALVVLGMTYLNNKEAGRD